MSKTRKTGIFYRFGIKEMIDIIRKAKIVMEVAAEAGAGQLLADKEFQSGASGHSVHAPLFPAFRGRLYDVFRKAVSSAPRLPFPDSSLCAGGGLLPGTAR